MHRQCVQRASITPEVWTNVNMTKTGEISEFRSPEISFIHIQWKEILFETFFSHDKTGRMKSDNFAIKTPVLRRLNMKKCQKCKKTLPPKKKQSKFR